MPNMLKTKQKTIEKIASPAKYQQIKLKIGRLKPIASERMSRNHSVKN